MTITVTAMKRAPRFAAGIAIELDGVLACVRHMHNSVPMAMDAAARRCWT